MRVSSPGTCDLSRPLKKNWRRAHLEAQNWVYHQASEADRLAYISRGSSHDCILVAL